MTDINLRYKLRITEKNISECQISKLLTMCIVIAVFCSSVVGLQIFGISLNKIGIIPLEIYGIFYIFFKHKILVRKNGFLLLSLYLVLILGSLLSFIFRRYYGIDEWADRLINNIVQYLLIYSIVVLFVFTYDNKKVLYLNFRKILVNICRFHVIYTMIQFVIWNIIGINITDLLFNDLFSNIFGGHFIPYGNTGSTIFLRITGLNSDAAFLSILMLIGFCFDKSIIFKLLYFMATVFSVSRVGMFSIGFISFSYAMIQLYKYRNAIKKKYMVYTVFSMFFLTIGFFLLYSNVDSIRTYVDLILSRIMTIFDSSADVYGTSRHMMYPFYAFYSWLFDLNIIEKIIGVGIRTEGLVFNYSPYISSFFDFNQTMLTSAWAIECDYASILLGSGLIGIILYIMIILYMKKSRDISVRYFALGLLVFGLMYDVFISTIVQLTLIFVLLDSSNEKEK